MRRMRLAWQQYKLQRNFGNVQKSQSIIELMITQTNEMRIKPLEKAVLQWERQALKLAGTKQKQKQMECMKQLRRAKARLLGVSKQVEMWTALKDNVADLWQNALTVHNIQNVASLLSGISDSTVRTLDKVFSKMEDINEGLVNLTEEIGSSTQSFNDASEGTGGGGFATEEELEEDYKNLVASMMEEQGGSGGPHTNGKAETETSLFRLEDLHPVELEDPSEKAPLVKSNRRTAAASGSLASATVRLSSLGLGPPGRNSSSASSSNSSLRNPLAALGSVTGGGSSSHDYEAVPLS